MEAKVTVFEENEKHKVIKTLCETVSSLFDGGDTFIVIEKNNNVIGNISIDKYCDLTYLLNGYEYHNYNNCKKSIDVLNNRAIIEYEEYGDKYKITVNVRGFKKDEYCYISFYPNKGCFCGKHKPW